MEEKDFKCLRCGAINKYPFEKGVMMERQCPKCGSNSIRLVKEKKTDPAKKEQACHERPCKTAEGGETVADQDSPTCSLEIAQPGAQDDQDDGKGDTVIVDAIVDR